MSMKLENFSSTSVRSKSLAELLLLGVSVALVASEKSVVRSWMSAVGPNSAWWCVPPFALQLAPLFDKSQVKLLLEVTHNMAQMAPGLEEPYALRLLDLVSSASQTDFDSYARRMKAIIAISPSGAKFAYNISALYQKRGLYLQEVESLEKAQELHPPYRSYSPIWRQLAWAYFLVHSYEKSVEAFEKAVELGHDLQEVTPLLAISLMHSGRYADARAYMAAWEPVRPEDSIGVMTKVVLDEIVGTLGINFQEPCFCSEEPCSRETLTQSNNLLPTVQALRNSLQNHTALHHQRWALLANAVWGESGSAAAVATVLFHPTMLQNWAAVLVKLSKSKADPILLKAVVLQARANHGEAIYDLLVEQLKSDQATDIRDHLMDLLNEVYSTEELKATRTIHGLDNSSQDPIVTSAQYRVVEPLS